MRFTGTEIHHDVDACVAEVVDYITSQGVASPTYAIYIDWLFFQRAVIQFERRNATNLPQRGLITRNSFVLHLRRLIDMPDSVAVHMFGTAATFSTSMVNIESSRLLASERTRFLMNEHQAEFLALDLLDHLKAHRPLYQDRVVLVADAGGYPPEFMDDDPHLAALIRLDSSQSRMMTVRARSWQDIDYLFAEISGIPLHELQ